MIILIQSFVREQLDCNPNIYVHKCVFKSVLINKKTKPDLLLGNVIALQADFEK